MSKFSTFDFDVSSALAIGSRTRQEDALAVAFPEGAGHGFAVLSDGMGGHASGDLASRTIVSNMFTSLTMGNLEDNQSLPRVLRQAMNGANDKLTSSVRAFPENHGMGGTVIAAVVNADRLYWISVGDSVLYLFRDNTLTRLNADHSMAPQLDLMVKRGMLSATEAADHPQRNVLTSALMGGNIADVDCPETPVSLRHGDIVILASDGLQFLPDPIIEALLVRAKDDDSRDIVKDLMGAVETIDDPEKDNTAIVVLRAEPGKTHARQTPIRSKSAAMLEAFRRVLPGTANMRSRS